MASLSLADFRKKYPQTNSLSDEDVISVIAQQYGASIEDTKTVLNYEPPAPRSRTWGEVAGDTLVTAVKSAVGLPQSIAGLIDIPTGGRVGKALEEAGYRPNEAQDMLSDMYSDPQKAANKNVADAQGFTDTLIAYAENPSAIATTVGESAGQMLGGAASARKLITLFPKLAPWAAGALGEGLMGAGSAESQLRAESEDGLTTAKQGLSALASGAGTAAFGALGGKIANSKLGQKVGIADIDTMLAGGGTAPKTTVGFLKSALASGFSEGALEEMPQSAWEQMMRNYAQDKPFLDGVEKSMASGLVAGFAMGGAGGGYNAMVSKVEPPADIMDQTDIDSVINAAQNSIDQAPIQQRESMPIDDPMRLEIINRLPEALRDAATRAYNIIIDDEAPKGIKKQNQKLLDDILAQAASEMQPTNTAPNDDLTIEQPKPLEPFEQIKLLQSKVSDLEANNPFEQDHMDSISELETAVANFTLSKIESGEMPVFASNGIVTVVTPSAKQEGLFQVTRYNKNGIFGDTEYASIAEAVEKEGLAYIAPLGNDEANTTLSKALDAESSYQSRLAEQKLKESNRVLADIESTDSRVSFEQEKSRVNQRNAIIDSILASDAAVDMRPAQIADMVKSSMAEQGYANPVLSDSEFSRIKRFNDIAKAEPVAETIDETNLEGQAPSSNLSDLVPERKVNANQSNVIATKLPADLISVAEESKTKQEFWKALTARKIPLGPERNALMAAYKELKAQPVTPTATPATQTTETTATAIPNAASSVTPTEIPNTVTSVTPTEIPNGAPSISTTAIPKTEIASSTTSIAPTAIPTSATSIAPAPKAFSTLLNAKSSTLISDDGKGRKLYEVKVTPQFGNKNFVNGRMPAADGLELKRKEDVTGNPSDNGYILIDSREQLAARRSISSQNTAGNSATAIPETTLKPDGNLSIKGNTKELQTQLKEAGIPSLPSKDGVTVGAKNVEKAQEFIASIVPTETKSTLPSAKPGDVVLQNRDRSGASSVEQMNSIASAPDYGRLSISRDFANGAPVVFADSNLPAGALVGKESYATATNGRRMPVQYAVFDAANIVASNKADGTTNTAYSSAVDGKVRVIAGNGRIAGLQEAYSRGTTQGYRAELMQDADHGIDPAAISQMQNPVLVRIMPKSEITADIGDISNTTGTAILSPVEQAANDSRRLDLSAIQFDDEGVSSESVTQFINSMPIAERGNLMNSDGTPTRQANDRLMSAVFHESYGNAELVQLYAQATDPESKTILNAMAMAAPRLVQLKNAGEFDIRDIISEAAQIAVNARRKGLKLSEWMQNIDFTQNPESVAIVKFMAENIRSAKRIGEGLNDLANAMIAAHNSESAGSMFTDLEKVTRSGVLNQFKGKYVKSESKGNSSEPSGTVNARQYPEQTANEQPGEAGNGTSQSVGSTREANNEAQDFQLTGETAQEARERIAQEEREAQARTEDEARLAALERDSTVQREIGNRQDVLADSFSLTAQVNDQAQQKKNDDQTFKDQLAGQADIFSSKPYDQARAQQLKNSIAEGELTLRTGKFNNRKLSPDELSTVRRGVESSKAKLADLGSPPNKTRYSKSKSSDTSSSKNKKDRDATYLALVESGNLEEAQKLVDQAALDAGYITANDYRMAHQAPNSNSDVSLSNVRESGLVPNDYWTHPHWYQSTSDERSSFNKIISALKRLDAAKEAGKSGNLVGMWVYRAVPKDVKDGTIRNGDWVSPSKEYAQSEGRPIPEGYKIISQWVPLKNLYWDANSINEMGVDDGKEYAYKNTKNNKKLVDVVTRDDEGNVIPLSKRFNSRSDDTRFSKSKSNESEMIDRAPALVNKSAKTELPKQFVELLDDAVDSVNMSSPDPLTVTELTEIIREQFNNAIDFEDLTIDLSFDEALKQAEKDGVIKFISTIAGTKRGNKIKADQDRTIQQKEKSAAFDALPESIKKKISDAANELNFLKYELLYLESDSTKSQFEKVRGKKELNARIDKVQNQYDEAMATANDYKGSNEANADNGLGDVKIVPAVIVEKNVKSILAEEGAVQVNVSGGNVDVLKQIAERFGKKIVFFREVETDRLQNKGVGLSTGSTQSKSATNEGSDSAQGENGSDEVTNGFVTPRQPKLVFLNVDGANHLTYILGHELGHSLKIDDPKLWAEMTVQLQPLVRKFGKYRAEYGQGLTNDVDVLEELVSDVIGDNFLNNAFWQDMAKQSQSLFKRIADKAIALLNKSIRLMVGRDVSIFISDMEKARSIIAETMLKYVDGVSKGRYEAIVNDASSAQQPIPSAIDVDGAYRRTTNNIGNSIAKNVDAIKKFWEWFGDSKTVTSSEQPMVLYHGTGSDFSSFDIDRVGGHTDTGMFGKGFYFSTDPKYSSLYAGRGENPNVMPVYVALKNPFITSDSSKLPVIEEPKTIEDMMRADVLYSEKLRNELISQGHDGVIFETSNGELEVVAFYPEQIKSATGNNGKFDGGNSDIRYSKSTTSKANPHSWDSPEETKFDNFLYKYQDKHIDTKRVVDAIDKNIADDLNVTEKEELYHNKAASRNKEFINNELRPLIDSMREMDIDIPTLDEYLHARTAEETNVLIAWRNRDTGILKDGGSGMKTADARKYLASLTPAQRTKLESLAAKVDAITEGTRQMYVDYGLESKSTIDGWRDMFDHYVPLMREQDGETQGMGVGQGFSVKGKEVKGRTGSTRKVVDIFANIAMQREKVIVRGEKNKVAKSLLELASANPNPEFWSVGKPETKRVYNPDTDSVVEQADPLFKSRENVIVAKVKDSKGNIQEKAVIFNESNPRALRMSQALKNLDTQQMNGFMGGMATVTRHFSAINTQYNPIFGVVNLVRDFQGALINLSSTALSGHKAEVAKHTLSALKAIYLDERAGKKGGKNNSAMAALWREFELEGGPTGYRDMFANSEDRAKAIEKELNPTKWMDSPLGKVFTANGMLKVPMAQAYKQASGLFGVLSDYNTAMENSVRLAAYKVAKDQGLSNQKAASLAKNLTVNFNRKGQVAQQVGALYAFFNASMQGSARLSQTLFTIDNGDIKTARLSSTGKKIVYGGVLLGVVQALMLSAAGLEEDEPPEFVRKHSLIIPTGWTGLTDEKAYINIPMPLGLHVLPNLGRIPTEFALNGFKKPTEKVIGLMGLIAGAFNPTGGGVSLLQAISPTAIDPIAAISENKDWTGKPIAKESYNRALPGHALTRDTASFVSKMLSEGINYVSGGTEYKKGVLSPTPDQIDYLFGQVTGGVGREAIKMQQSISATMTGEDLPSYKVPLVGRFYGNAESQSSQANRFYANVDLLNEHETVIKGMREDRKGLELARYMRENPEARMFEAANKVEREIQQLRKAKRDLIKADAEPAKIKMIENQIKMRMTRFNESFKSVSKSLE